MLPQSLVQSQFYWRMDQHKACLFSTSTSPIFSSLAWLLCFSHSYGWSTCWKYIKSIWPRHQNIDMTVDVYKMLNLVLQMSFMSPRNVNGSYLQPPNVYWLITAASCDCPASKGSSASCKHVARCSGLCTSWILGIRKVTRISNMHRQAQQRNKPRLKKVDLIPVSEFSKRKFDIVNKRNKDIFIREWMLSKTSVRLI